VAIQRITHNIFNYANNNNKYKKEQQIINISKDSEQMQCETKWQRLVVVVVFACLLVCYFLTAVGLDVSAYPSPHRTVLPLKLPQVT